MAALDRQEHEEAPDEPSPSEQLQARLTWQDEALDTLKGIPAAAFEILCQRVLRESGFIQVEVTGRTGFC